MRILVTGATGMLGYALLPALQQGHQVRGLGSVDCDVRDKEAVRRTFYAHKPELVIHLAAYTDVDGCEVNPTRAEEVNGAGTRNVALACAGIGATMLYVSTDYVFDGNKVEAYSEEDEPNPINIYGYSKLLGERHVQALLNYYFIVRTSWLYGPRGKNFVATILELARQQHELEVVNDQCGSPTYTRHLAFKLLELVATKAYGTYHITGSGRCSWLEFAQTIVELAGLKEVRVVPVSSEDCGRPAHRPRNSVLGNQRLSSAGLRPLPPWKDALVDYFTELEHEDELRIRAENHGGAAARLGDTIS